ncbi:MAG: polymerase sigma factor, sigma-70 family [Planctomycetota bacterium]|nr:polymerase sigma factor, sigma-70 family [Planctomycetota bacterium]
MARIEPERLGRLFDEHAAALGLYARSWCEAPEDVVQEAFVKLAGERNEPERPEAWLYRVVRNQAISASRSFWRRRKRERSVSLTETWFTKTDDRIDAQEAVQLLSELDPETRAVIVARIWGGLTFDEVAKSQGCSIATVHRRYQAGLQRLQERIEPSWIAPKTI